MLSNSENISSFSTLESFFSKLNRYTPDKMPDIDGENSSILINYRTVQAKIWMLDIARMDDERPTVMPESFIRINQNITPIILERFQCLMNQSIPRDMQFLHVWHIDEQDKVTERFMGIVFSQDSPMS